jgi:hypothetical protein
MMSKGETYTAISVSDNQDESVAEASQIIALLI